MKYVPDRRKRRQGKKRVDVSRNLSFTIRETALGEEIVRARDIDEDGEIVSLHTGSYFVPGKLIESGYERCGTVVDIRETLVIEFPDVSRCRQRVTRMSKAMNIPLFESPCTVPGMLCRRIGNVSGDRAREFIGTLGSWCRSTISEVVVGKNPDYHLRSSKFDKK